MPIARRSGHTDTVRFDIILTVPEYAYASMSAHTIQLSFCTSTAETIYRQAIDFYLCAASVILLVVGCHISVCLMYLTYLIVDRYADSCERASRRGGVTLSGGGIYSLTQ
jgi:hypothetical protein